MPAGNKSFHPAVGGPSQELDAWPEVRRCWRLCEGTYAVPHICVSEDAGLSGSNYRLL